MTQQLDGAPDVYDDQNLPLPSDAEPNTIDSLIPAFQQLLDSVRYVRDAVFDAAHSSGGARKLWSFADTAALKAETNQADGHLAFVRDTGLYRFHAAGAEGESLPWIIAPTIGGGRWKHVLLSVLDVVAGLPKLDGSAKVPLARSHNAIIETAQAEPDEIYAYTDNAWHDVPNGITVLGGGVTSGDIVEAEAMVMWTADVDTMYARLAIGSDGSTPIALPAKGAAGDLIPGTLVRRYVCSGDDVTEGSVPIFVQTQRGAGGPGGFLTVKSIRARVIRP